MLKHIVSLLAAAAVHSGYTPFQLIAAPVSLLLQVEGEVQLRATWPRVASGGGDGGKGFLCVRRDTACHAGSTLGRRGVHGGVCLPEVRGVVIDRCGLDCEWSG